MTMIKSELSRHEERIAYLISDLNSIFESRNIKKEIVLIIHGFHFYKNEMLLEKNE